MLPPTGIVIGRGGAACSVVGTAIEAARAKAVATAVVERRSEVVIGIPPGILRAPHAHEDDHIKRRTKPYLFAQAYTCPHKHRRISTPSWNSDTARRPAGGR